MTIQIDARRCPANHRCPAVRSCPVNALHQQGNGVPTVDDEACVDCGRCTMVCPTGALQPDQN